MFFRPDPNGNPAFRIDGSRVFSKFPIHKLSVLSVALWSIQKSQLRLTQWGLSWFGERSWRGDGESMRLAKKPSKTSGFQSLLSFCRKFSTDCEALQKRQVNACAGTGFPQISQSLDFCIPAKFRQTPIISKMKKSGVFFCFSRRRSHGF